MSNVPTLEQIKFAVKAIVSAEKSVVGGAYAALVAVYLRQGSFAERGFAANNVRPVAFELAAQREGQKAWDALTETDRATRSDACMGTAKRYVEKAVGICKQAAAKQLSMLDVLNAADDKEAAAIVKAWLFGLKCHSTDALFAEFGFSKPTAEKKPKEATPQTPSTPEVSKPQQAMDATGAPVESVRVALGTVSDLVMQTRAMLKMLSEGQRREYARAMYAELAELAATPELLAA
jgi:hypothetical protein